MRSSRNAVHPLFRIYPTTAVRSMARASIKNVPMTFAWNSRPSDCEFESDSCSLHSITSNGRSNLVLNQNAVLGFVVFYTSPCEFWYFCCRLWEKKVEKKTDRFLTVITKTSMRSNTPVLCALTVVFCARGLPRLRWLPRMSPVVNGDPEEWHLLIYWSFESRMVVLEGLTYNDISISKIKWNNSC